MTVVKNKSGDKNLAKSVVGTDDPNNQARGGGDNAAGDGLDPQWTNKLQNKQFRQNMRELGIHYHKDKVIQIFNVESVTGTPGIYRLYYSSMVCAGIEIIAFYSGERALLFPLQTCVCAAPDGTTRTKFDDEVISAFIQVPKKQLAAAKKILANIKLATPTAPFDENQLCINANNIGNLRFPDPSLSLSCCS